MKTMKAVTYKMIPPDGGYAHLINLATIIILTFSIVPTSSVALIFGPFLSEHNYDETKAIAVVTSVFVTLSHLTGVLTNFFLEKISYRKVALVGALLQFFGGFASAFVTNFKFLIIFYGIIQGLGTGLMIPATMSAFNMFFDKKKSMYIAIGQTTIASISMFYPELTRLLLENYGFRGTQILFTAINMHTIAAALLLQPVKWHLIHKLVEEEPIIDKSGRNEYSETLLSRMDSKSSIIPENVILSEASLVLSQKSSISLTTINKLRKKKFYFMDLSLLKDYSYWILAIGLSVSVISETNFMAILPVTLFNLGFDKNQVSLLMTSYFTSDCVSRLIFIVFVAFFNLNMRKVFLINIVLTIILRIVFCANLSFSWVVFTIISMGISRCFIQSTVPMVLAEVYNGRFTSAFSFYMTINGLLSIIIGALIGFVKFQNSNHMEVSYFLTAIFFICVIPWTIQIIISALQPKTKKILLSN